MKALLIILIAGVMLYELNDTVSGKQMNTTETITQEASGKATVIYIVIPKAEHTKSPIMEYVTWGLVSSTSLIAIVTAIIKLKRKWITTKANRSL